MGVALALSGCRSPAPQEVPAFLPGIYVSQSENEFCRIVDTFIVRKNSLEGGGYEVTRRSSFQRIRLGTRMPLEYQTEQWYGIYDVQRKALMASDKGKELYYSADQNRVYNGNTSYEKVE
jgi:hypothetical protein